MDTPQQRLALRHNPTARKVRARFPEGTRVETRAGERGTVVRHVPATTSLGGVLVVEWENGRIGRITPIAANVWPIIEKETHGFTTTLIPEDELQ
jgi:hypothetical protein